MCQFKKKLRLGLIAQTLGTVISLPRFFFFFQYQNYRHVLPYSSLKKKGVGFSVVVCLFIELPWVCFVGFYD